MHSAERDDQCDQPGFMETAAFRSLLVQILAVEPSKCEENVSSRVIHQHPETDASRVS